MKAPTNLPTIEKALLAVAAARAMLAAWIAPVCRGHLYPMRIRRGNKRYLYYTWERCVGGKRIQRTVRLDQVERIAAGIRAMAGLQARLESYCAACDTLALVEVSGVSAEGVKKTVPSFHGKTRPGARARRSRRRN
jgi:hypothetical protein